MSLGTSGVGTKFRRLVGASYEDIAEITKITGPGMTRNTIDVTSLDSTQGFMEYIVGLIDAGDMKLDMIFRRDTYEVLEADFLAGTVRDYQMILPGPGKLSLSFQGIVTEIPLDVPKDDAITCACNIKITGPVTTDSDSGS